MDSAAGRADASFLDLSAITVMRGGRVVLGDLSLKVGVGECVAIFGPNGCGKSTLVQTLTRELYPVVKPGMHLRIFGRERWDVTELRRSLGIVASALPPRDALSAQVMDVVTAGFFSAARLWPHLSPTMAMREHAAAAMKQLGVMYLARRALGTLSAGEQKRVMIARALCCSGDDNGRRVLIVDEPSNALDLGAQHELRELLLRLTAEGVGLVMVTHHTHDISAAFQRVLLMQRGQVVADGAPHALLTSERLTRLFGLPVSVERRGDRYFAG